MQVKQCTVFSEVPHERGILVRQRHRAEGNAACETRSELAQAAGFGDGEGKL
jgi:hypothetical protein